jgi:hypothetical protein
MDVHTDDDGLRVSLNRVCGTTGLSVTTMPVHEPEGGTCDADRASLDVPGCMLGAVRSATPAESLEIAGGSE